MDLTADPSLLLALPDAALLAWIESGPTRGQCVPALPSWAMLSLRLGKLRQEGYVYRQHRTDEPPGRFWICTSAGRDVAAGRPANPERAPAVTW